MQNETTIGGTVAKLIAASVALFGAYQAGYVVHNHEIKMATVVVKYDYADGTGMWGPFFGRCYNDMHARVGYCTTLPAEVGDQK